MVYFKPPPTKRARIPSRRKMLCHQTDEQITHSQWYCITHSIHKIAFSPSLSLSLDVNAYVRIRIYLSEEKPQDIALINI